MEQRRIDAGRLEVSQLCLGTMMFGTTVPERTAFAILDRFVEAGGSFLDTANCYQFWTAGGTGEESELLLGRWLASRGHRDQLVIATKVGARPAGPAVEWPANMEGLSAPVVAEQIDASLKRLGLDHVDLYYAHHEDRGVALEETVDAFASVVQAGKARALGVSNHPAWRVERARRIAAETGVPGYTCVQQRHSYLQMKPGADYGRMPPASDDLLDYVRSDPELTLLAYSPLLGGAYSGRPDRPIEPLYDHPGTTARLAVLHEVAREVGGTPNQVVLGWLMASAPSVLPLFSASSVEQLDEALAATELKLDADQLHRLSTAG